MEPTFKTPEALQQFLESCEAELRATLPQLQIILGKLEAAKKISAELLHRRVDI